MENKEQENLQLKAKEIESKEHEIRLEKVKQMQAGGISPWPSYKPVDTTTSNAKLEYEKNPEEVKKLALAGRLMTIRDHGKTFSKCQISPLLF